MVRGEYLRAGGLRHLDRIAHCNGGVVALAVRSAALRPSGVFAMIPLPYRLLAGVLLAIGLAGGGFAYGLHVAHGEAAQEKLEQALAYAKALADEQVRGEQIASDAEKRIAILRAGQRQRSEEIIHETAKPDYRCAVPESGRLLLRTTIRAANAARSPGQTGAGNP